MVHDGDAVAKLVRFVHVMRGEQNGQVALLLQAREHLPHGHARHRVEARGGLVEKKYSRLVHQPPRDFEPPPHAAGQVLDGLVRPLGELDRLERLPDNAHPAFPRHAVELGENQYILPGAQVEIGRHRLGNHPNRLAHFAREAPHVEAVDPRRARGGHEQRGQHADQRRLAGAVRPEQPENLPVLDLESDAVDGREFAKAFGDFFDLDGREAGSWVRGWGCVLRRHYE